MVVIGRRGIRHDGNIERIHWVLATNRCLDLFTNHKNLFFLFNPTAIVADLSQTTMRVTLRWGVCLSAYNYIYVHIPGSLNFWADITSSRISPPIIRKIVTVPVLLSFSASEFVWRSFEEPYAAQLIHLDCRPTDIFRADYGLYRASNGTFWVLDAPENIQLRLCITAHKGPNGHRALEPKLSSISPHFFWSTLTGDVTKFVFTCIHCLSAIGGRKVPRPYGPAVNRTWNVT